MKHLDYSSSFLLMFFFNIAQGHGFQAETLVHCKKNSFAIDRVSQAVSNTKDSVVTFNLSLRIEELEHEIRTAKSSSNCYFKIGFDLLSSHDIRCTPSQEFYLTLEKKWVPAFKLKQGDLLFSKTDGLVAINRIDFFEQPLDVYSIEVKRNHNYFVGRYGVLTHNMFVPLVFNVGTAAVFSSGAAAGGVLSGCFGPIAVIGGAALGGIIGVVIKKIVHKNKVPTYDVCFDVDKINGQRSGTFDVKSVETDRHGAQAPGKPTENDGFIPKKNWDGKKVRNPNGRGYGWPDDKGNIWVPTGPRGHGCPHWDVEKPDGDHVNIVPGGRIRGKL